MPTPSSSTSDTLSDRLTAELKAATTGINGVSAQHVGVVVLHTGGHFIIRTSFTGWSPVLHETRIVHERQYEPTGVDGTVVPLDDFTPPSQVLDMLVAIQRARSVDAARLGHRHWLAKREIGHVSIDRALPDILKHGHATTRMAVHEAIARAHSSIHDYRGGPTLKAGGVVLTERLGADGEWIRLALPNLKIAHPVTGRRFATLHGFELDIDIETGHLPDTVVAALPGHGVGDVVCLHPILDGRPITKAVRRTHKACPGIILTIELDVDLLDTVLGEVAA